MKKVKLDLLTSQQKKKKNTTSIQTVETRQQKLKPKTAPVKKVKK